MNCPVCKSDTLVEHELVSGPMSMSCSQCGGVWISGKEYWDWQDKHGINIPELPPSDISDLELKDSAGAKICVDCGHIMLSYKVGRGVTFLVDHCTTCYGIWLDKNEWDVLERRKLHDDIHYFFSEAYQAGLYHAERETARQRMWMARLGEADYHEADKVREWLENHPRKSEIIAFILH